MSLKDKVFFSIIGIFGFIQVLGVLLMRKAWEPYGLAVNLIFLLVMAILCLIKHETNIFNDEDK